MSPRPLRSRVGHIEDDPADTDMLAVMCGNRCLGCANLYFRETRRWRDYRLGNNALGKLSLPLQIAPRLLEKSGW